MSEDPRFDALLSDFAAHLVPEAFGSFTRADRVLLEPVDLSTATGDVDAAVWFDRWVVDRLEDALEAVFPDGHPWAVVYVSDGRVRRRYVDCGCGNLSCATNPATDEVFDVATPWLFAADLPRPAPVWQPLYDDEGVVVDDILVEPSEGRWRATWYAEARGRGVVASRAGIIHLDGAVVVDAERITPRDTMVTRDLHGILRGHPARRRHPLRGRR